MNIQYAQNELHRAHTAATCGQYVASAKIAMDAHRLALACRSKHAATIAAAALAHAETMNSKGADK